MIEYPKIDGPFVRDPKGKVILGQWRLPEFEYLKDNLWAWTEKIDGTNIRIGWDGEKVEFGGRSADSQMRTDLLIRLQELFPPEKFGIFDGAKQVVLFGEGYGARIQKGGGNYKSDGVDFILFDVWIDGWWLKDEDMRGIAAKLDIDAVPDCGEASLSGVIANMSSPTAVCHSHFGEFQLEGFVGKPLVPLSDRRGNRIVVKLKFKDLIQ